MLYAGETFVPNNSCTLTVRMARQNTSMAMPLQVDYVKRLLTIMFGLTCLGEAPSGWSIRAKKVRLWSMKTINVNSDTVWYHTIPGTIPELRYGTVVLRYWYHTIVALRVTKRMP